MANAIRTPVSGQIRRIVSFLGFTGRANAAHTKPDSPDCRLDDVEKEHYEQPA